MNIAFPFQIDGRGRTAAATDDEHIRELIEQVLFTSPGERVNRPTFGTGLAQLVFAPSGPELAAASQYLVQGALQQWLGDLIQLESLNIQSEESTLTVTVQYLVRRTQRRQVASFSRSS